MNKSRKTECKRARDVFKRTIHNLVNKGWDWRGGAYVTKNYGDPSLTINYYDAAVAESKKHREEVAARPAMMAEFISANGWTELEVSPGYWSKPNWDKEEGFCVRSLAQAYKIESRRLTPA